MARRPRRDLPRRPRRPELSRLAAALLLAAAGAAAAADLRGQALAATAAADLGARRRTLGAGSGTSRAPPAYLSQARSELRHREAQPLLAEARRLERARDWGGADAAWRRALAADPGLKSAQQGRARAAPYLAALRELARLRAADNPFDPAVLERIRRWLAGLEARRLRGPQLAAAARELSALLAAAEVPVALTLTSDGESELEIYGVGKLGRVARETLHAAARRLHRGGQPAGLPRRPGAAAAAAGQAARARPALHGVDPVSEAFRELRPRPYRPPAARAPRRAPWRLLGWSLLALLLAGGAVHLWQSVHAVRFELEPATAAVAVAGPHLAHAGRVWVWSGEHEAEAAAPGHRPLALRWTSPGTDAVRARLRAAAGAARGDHRARGWRRSC